MIKMNLNTYKLELYTQTLAADIISVATLKGMNSTDLTSVIGRVLATSSSVLNPAAYSCLARFFIKKQELNIAHLKKK